MYEVYTMDADVAICPFTRNACVKNCALFVTDYESINQREVSHCGLVSKGRKLLYDRSRES